MGKMTRKQFNEKLTEETCAFCKHYTPFMSDIYWELTHWGSCFLMGDNYHDTEQEKTCKKWELNPDGFNGSDTYECDDDGDIYD